jgi:hypothetical protein
MWKEFYKLNRHKFLKPILVLWTAMTIFILLLFWISPQSRDKVSLLSVLDLILIYATAITAMVVILSIPVGVYKFWKTRLVFNQPNFEAFFEKHAFKTAFINRETKWSFTEEIKTGIIEGFPVLVKRGSEDPRFIEFQFQVQSEPINKQEYKELEKAFKNDQANFDIGCISKKISRDMPAAKIEKYLTKFASLLTHQKFTRAQQKPG